MNQNSDKMMDIKNIVLRFGGVGSYSKHII